MFQLDGTKCFGVLIQESCPNRPMRIMIIGTRGRSHTAVYSTYTAAKARCSRPLSSCSTTQQLILDRFCYNIGLYSTVTTKVRSTTLANPSPILLKCRVKHHVRRSQTRVPNRGGCTSDAGRSRGPRRQKNGQRPQRVFVTDHRPGTGF